MMKTYGIPELAELFGVHRNTVHRIIKRGDIQTIRIGKRQRVTQEELDRYLGKQDRNGNAA